MLFLFPFPLLFVFLKGVDSMGQAVAMVRILFEKALQLELERIFTPGLKHDRDKI